MIIWLWKTHNPHLLSYRNEFVELGCRMPTMQHTLVAIGAKPNPSAAQRAIEKGEVWWRKDYDEKYLKVNRHDQPLVEGWPIELRWSKPYSTGYAQIMVPVELDFYARLGPVKQGRRLWSHLMPDTTEPTWLHCQLDLLENLWRIL